VEGEEVDIARPDLRGTTAAASGPGLNPALSDSADALISCTLFAQ